MDNNMVNANQYTWHLVDRWSHEAQCAELIIADKQFGRRQKERYLICRLHRGTYPYDYTWSLLVRLLPRDTRAKLMAPTDTDLPVYMRAVAGDDNKRPYCWGCDQDAVDRIAGEVLA